MSEVICHGGAAWTVLFNQTSQLHKFSAVEPEQQQSVSPAHQLNAIHSFPLYKLSVIKEIFTPQTQAKVFKLSSVFGGFSFNVGDVLPPQENKLYLFILHFPPFYFQRYSLFKQERKTVHDKNWKKKRKMLLVWFTKSALII